jgi:hypothetical protein
MRVAFDSMDASESLSLDLGEIAPFLQYSFALLFGVELSTGEAEALFLIADTYQSTAVTMMEKTW